MVTGMSESSSPLNRDEVAKELRRKAHWRRGLYFVLVVLSTLAGSYLMADVLRANGFTGIEMAILALFTSDDSPLVPALIRASERVTRPRCAN